MKTRTLVLTIGIIVVLTACAAPPQFSARDPGVRGGPAGAGNSFTALTTAQKAFFAAGRDAFVEVEGIGDGLGPRFNLDSCVGCHAQPDVGGLKPPGHPPGGRAGAEGGAILANHTASTAARATLGIGGRPQRLLPTGDPNRTGNDGTITRFGWKAQNKSLLMFAGEAYNVEQGISNELFPQEREEACQFKTVPNDTTDVDAATGTGAISDVEKFAFFMRFLAPPEPSTTMPGGSASITHGKELFVTVGCALCHTPMLRTANSPVTAINNQPVNLYSDLLLHNMGPGLADDIVQGLADGDEFRTAPLWGLGQRIFLLHDGRTTDLLEAIFAHKSIRNLKYRSSEANGVVGRFRSLGDAQKQDLLNFLRSL